ncbi:MAG: MazG family protein [Chloroflexi bacterium]|nr:MazG family protein [Chloroflexota bacterium]
MSGEPGVDRGAASPDAAREDTHTVDGLRAIMARLYAPGGCPWDGEQTHESLRGSLIEEGYEAVEAIDRGDLAGLSEELGDLLMQIVFHTTIAEAAGDFSFDEVVEAICLKMLRRHPHVFGGEEASDSSAVWARWEEIKAQERAESGADDSPASALASLPRALPALQRAQSLIGRAERSGIAPVDTAPLRARDEGDGSGGEELLGALLWAVARYARAHDIDAESALRERAGRYIEAVTAAAAGDEPG